MYSFSKQPLFSLKINSRINGETSFREVAEGVSSIVLSEIIEYCFLSMTYAGHSSVDSKMEGRFRIEAFFPKDYDRWLSESFGKSRTVDEASLEGNGCLQKWGHVWRQGVGNRKSNLLSINCGKLTDLGMNLRSVFKNVKRRLRG